MNNPKCSECNAANLPNAKYCANCGHELPRPVAERPELPPLPPISPTKPSERNKILLALLLGVVFWSGVYAVKKYFINDLVGDKIIQVMAKQANATCPMMIDDQTRLESVVPVPGNKLQYNYTLVNLDKSQVPADKLKEALLPGIIENIKTNPALKMFKENGTTMIHSFNDKNGEQLLYLVVTKEMYK